MTTKSLIRYWILALVLSCRFIAARSQNPQQIIIELHQINQQITDNPCDKGNGILISYKAMNVFLSNKVSSYFSDKGDLSLYKNFVNINAAKGTIAINHNLHQPDTTNDNYVRSFTTIGARTGFANAYAARFSNAYTSNQLGGYIQKVWMGRPKTKFNFCGIQKQNMDAQRALLVNQLSAELDEKAVAFKKELDQITAADLPGQNLKAAKATLSTNFCAALRATYLRKFAEAQSALLVNTNNYKVVKDSWTILGIYLPIIPQKFYIITGTEENTHYNYPAELMLTHTLFWEAPKAGRIFFSLGAGIIVNNAVQGGQLTSTGVNGSYAGKYNNYLTPATSVKLVYIPLDSHIGLSFRLEKNYGDYKALNGILGIPIVLIDKRGVPAVNFECQIILDDMNHTIKSTLPGNGSSIGLTVGIPFSKIVY
ncbi:MAG: hypothetical protein ABI184_09550 [Ginsengibacter sp.]